MWEIVNNYKITYNILTETYQVDHLSCDEIPMMEFNTLREAQEYAVNG